MSVIASDGLSLLVGDGGSPEVFTALNGVSLRTLELTQKNHSTGTLGGTAWLTTNGASARQAVLECDAYATNDAPALRLRSLMLSGATGNVKLKLSASETLSFAALVTRYREIIEAGNVKRLIFRLESSGVVSVG